jgi:hypothetical protein
VKFRLKEFKKSMTSVIGVMDGERERLSAVKVPGTDGRGIVKQDEYFIRRLVNGNVDVEQAKVEALKFLLDNEYDVAEFVNRLATEMGLDQEGRWEILDYVNREMAKYEAKLEAASNENPSDAWDVEGVSWGVSEPVEQRDWTPIETRLGEIIRSARNYTGIVALTGEDRLRDRTTNLRMLTEDQNLVREIGARFSDLNDPHLSRILEKALYDIGQLIEDQTRLSRLDEYKPEIGPVGEWLDSKIAQMQELRSASRSPIPGSSNQQLVLDRIEEEKEFVRVLKQLTEVGDEGANSNQGQKITQLIAEANENLVILNSEAARFENMVEEGRKFEAYSSGPRHDWTEPYASNSINTGRGSLPGNVLGYLARTSRDRLRRNVAAVTEAVTPRVRALSDWTKSAGHTFMTHRDWLGGRSELIDGVVRAVKYPIVSFHNYLDRVALEHRALVEANIAKRTSREVAIVASNGTSSHTQKILGLQDLISSLTYRMKQGLISREKAEENLRGYMKRLQKDSPGIDIEKIKENATRLFARLETEESERSTEYTRKLGDLIERGYSTREAERILSGGYMHVSQVRVENGPSDDELAVFAETEIAEARYGNAARELGISVGEYIHRRWISPDANDHDLNLNTRLHMLEDYLKCPNTEDTNGDIRRAKEVRDLIKVILRSRRNAQNDVEQHFERQAAE